ncbi:MAG: hypothetical protein ACFFD4_13315 [Candidatus Odinarchaeota archaeon]
MRVPSIVLKTIAAFAVTVVINVSVLLMLPGYNLLAFLLGLGVVIIFLSPGNANGRTVAQRSRAGRNVLEKSGSSPLTYQAMVDDLEGQEHDPISEVNSLLSFGDVFTTMAQEASRGTYYTEITGSGKRIYTPEEITLDESQQDPDSQANPVSKLKTPSSSGKQAKTSEVEFIPDAGSPVSYREELGNGPAVKLKIDPDGRQHYIFEESPSFPETSRDLDSSPTFQEEFDDFIFEMDDTAFVQQPEDNNNRAGLPASADRLSAGTLQEDKKATVIKRFKNLNRFYGYKLESLSNQYNCKPDSPVQSVAVHLNKLELIAMTIEDHDELLVAEQLFTELETLLVNCILNDSGMLSVEFFGNSSGVTNRMEAFKTSTAESSSIADLLETMENEVTYLVEILDLQWLKRLLDIAIKINSQSEVITEITESLILEIVSIVVKWVAYLKERIQ